MTFIAAFHLDSYCLMGADSRATFYLPSSVDDEYLKVHATPSGVIAGSGFTSITDFVSARLKERPKLSSQDVTKIMSKRFAEFIPTLPADGYPIEAKRTAWLLATRRKGRLALELYHSDNRFVAQYVNVGVPMTLLPLDITLEQLTPTLLAYKDRLNPISDLKHFDESLEYHFEVMQDLMRELHSMSEYSGPSMHIGYYRIDGEMEVFDDLVAL